MCGGGGGNKGLGGRCGGSVKLRFLIRGGIPEPEQSHHQTVLPLWRPNGGMRFSRRYGGTFGLSGGVRYTGPGGETREGYRRDENVESKAPQIQNGASEFNLSLSEDKKFQNAA